MASQIQQTTSAILSEIKLIQENRKQRNQIYQSCIENYKNNLKKQIQMIKKTDETNHERNKNISSSFQNVYDQIVTGSHVTLRKIKQTSHEKKLFWEDLIKNNAALNDLQLKKDFYLQKRDAEDRYYDAIEQQKVKKIPYAALFGINKKKQGLRDWQQKNRTFQQKAYKGTATLNQWRNNWQKNTQPGEIQNFYKGSTQISGNRLQNQFMRTNQDIINRPGSTQINNNTSYAYESGNKGDFDFLKNFQKKI